MRTLKLIGFFLAACLPVLVLAASSDSALDTRAWLDQCSESFDGEIMQECLARQVAKESQEALRHAEEDAAQLLRSLQIDEDEYDKDIARNWLIDSNWSFVRHRDSYCAFLNSLSPGEVDGSPPINHFSCVADVNHKRTRWLQDVVSGAASTDPVLDGRALCEECIHSGLSQTGMQDRLENKHKNS